MQLTTHRCMLTSTQLHTNFGRNFTHVQLPLHAPRMYYIYTHARAARLGKIFPRSRRALDTAEKSSREQQALLEY
eukprot:COSAG02_NODE_5115_length_4615_cov_5.118025_4_plen_74_part_01